MNDQERFAALRERLSRQMRIKELGEDGEKRILKTRFLVIGAGGLGSPALLYLASSGASHITVVDPDEVSENNLQEVPKTVPLNNKTYKNHSDQSNIESNHIRSDHDGMRCEQGTQKVEEYSELIKNNIDFEFLLQEHERETDLVEEIFQLILEVVMTEKDTVRIAKEQYPAGFVKSKFLKLNHSHIEYVLECMSKNTTEIRNIKQYLLTVLFNAPSTMGSYYKAAVNHDMPQFAS